MVLSDLRENGFCSEASPNLSVISMIQNRIKDAIQFLTSIHMVRRYLLLNEYILVWEGYDEVGRYLQTAIQSNDKVGIN